MEGGETWDEDELPVPVVCGSWGGWKGGSGRGSWAGASICSGSGRSPLHGSAMVLLAGAGEAMKVTCHGPGSSREGDPLGVGGRDAGVSRGRYRGGRVSTV